MQICDHTKCLDHARTVHDKQAHAAAHKIVRDEQFNVLLRTHMQMMIGDWIGLIKTIAAMCYLENA